MNYTNWSEKKIRFWMIANELGVMIFMFGLIIAIPEKVYAGTGKLGVASFFLAINIGLAISMSRSRRAMAITHELAEQAVKNAEEHLAEDMRRKAEFIRLNKEAVRMWQSRGEIAMAASHKKILKSLGIVDPPPGPRAD